MFKSRHQVEQEILVGMKKVFGRGFEKGVTMDVSPNVVQTTEEKIRQTYAFLNMISSTPTEQDSGQVLSLLEGKSLGQRTVSVDSNHKRRPVAVGGFTGREFKCLELELDVIISWATQLQWGAQSGDVFNLYRDYILRSRALSRLRLMFYGQSENLTVQTDLSTYPMMEDVGKGFFQYMIDNNPDNVLGITVGGITAKGYDINPIQVGEGGDFSSMAQLADYMKNTMIPRIYRGNTNIKAIAGDSLLTHDINQVIANSGNDAMQRAATETLLGMATIAKIPAFTPDEFPERGLIITDPLNLDFTYQVQSVRRSIEESADKKGLVDYSWQKVDCVIKDVAGIAMVHPDAIQLKDSSGAWVSAADQWFIEPVA